MPNACGGLSGPTPSPYSVIRIWGFSRGALFEVHGCLTQKAFVVLFVVDLFIASLFLPSILFRFSYFFLLI